MIRTWALLRWCSTKRRYIKCTYLYLYLCVFIIQVRLSVSVYNTPVSARYRLLCVYNTGARRRWVQPQWSDSQCGWWTEHWRWPQESSSSFWNETSSWYTKELYAITVKRNYAFVCKNAWHSYHCRSNTCLVIVNCELVTSLYCVALCFASTG